MNKEDYYVISCKKKLRTILEERVFPHEEFKKINQEDEKYYDDFYSLIHHEIINDVSLEKIKEKFGSAGIFAVMEIFSEKNIPISMDIQKLFYEHTDLIKQHLLVKKNRTKSFNDFKSILIVFLSIIIGIGISYFIDKVSL